MFSPHEPWEKARGTSLISFVFRAKDLLQPFLLLHGEPVINANEDGKEYQCEQCGPVNQPPEHYEKESHVLRMSDISINPVHNQTFCSMNFSPAQKNQQYSSKGDPCASNHSKTVKCFSALFSRFPSFPMLIT